MTQGERALRADAERNRRRVLDAAGELFRERGLEVGVGEIAEHAGVGRGTLFRNFPSKEALIAAILVERMGEAVDFGQALLESADPGEALFEFLAEIVGRQQVDRAVFEAVADIWLANDEIRAAHAQIVGVLGELLGRAQEAGAVRADIGPMDVLMMFKGVCEAAASYAHIDAQIIPRHLDLLRAALRADPAPKPLRGRAPTLEEVERMALQSSEPAPATAQATTARAPATAVATTARAPVAAPATTAPLTPPPANPAAPSHHRFEPVADPAQRCDRHRRSELAAERRHVHVDGLGRDVVGPPHKPEQLLAGVYPARIAK